MNLTAFQTRVLGVPETYNLALLGGRGGGKTVTELMLVLRHCEQYADKARPLLVRETLAALREITDELDRLLNQVYPRGVRANRQEHIWRLPNGAIVECGHLASPDDFNRYQGRSFSLLLGDEAGQFKTLRYFYLLRSNLRLGQVPCRTVIAANPGGRLHAVLQQKYAAHPPWHPFQSDDGEMWVHAPSTLKDNPHLPPDYENKLRAAVGRDKELLKAWIDGDWTIARGAYFAGCLDPSRQMLPITDRKAKGLIEAVPQLWLPRQSAETFVSADWGQTAPAVAFACARLNQPVGSYPRGSLILMDETHSADPEDWSVGLGWSPGRFAEAIGAMADRMKVKRQGVLDDARGLGADETLIKFMRTQKLYFNKPTKSRVQGWATMRELMTNSYERNGKPGMWVSERCRGFWETVPLVPRDPLHPEDLDTSAIDHWADAARYAATRISRVVTLSHRPL